MLSNCNVYYGQIELIRKSTSHAFWIYLETVLLKTSYPLNLLLFGSNSLLNHLCLCVGYLWVRFNRVVSDCLVGCFWFGLRKLFSCVIRCFWFGFR